MSESCNSVIEQILDTKSLIDVASPYIYTSTNPILTILPGATVKFRMIGPLVNAQRLFLDYKQLKIDGLPLSVKEIKSLIMGREHVDISSFNKISDQTKILLQDLKHRGNNNWIDCIASNIIDRMFNTSHLKIYFFPRTIMRQIISIIKSRMSSIGAIPMSGIYAHDISITNSGSIKKPAPTASFNNGLINSFNNFQQNIVSETSSSQSHYKVDVSETPNHLTKDEIQLIVKHGLIDVKNACMQKNTKTFARWINNGYMRGFFYRFEPSCIMDKEQYRDLLEEIERFEAVNNSEREMELASLQIQDFPEHIMGTSRVKGTIHNLDLD